MKVFAKVPALITLGTLYTIPHGSLGQPGADGGGGGLPGSNGSGGGPPGGVSSSDDANNVYCEEDGSSAHYEEIFSGSGSAMMRYGGSHTGCPNHVNWDINPNSAQHNPTNTSIPAYPLMLEDGGTTDLSSTANAVGIMRNGVVLFSAWARDQVLEYEDTAFYLEADSFDLCGGHSTTEGTYHYHGTAGCLQEQAQLDAGTSSGDHSALLGWAYDGFPIYGQLGPDGVEMKMCGLDGADATHCLDVCSGYEALIPDVDDFAYRYYTSCGFDESFFPFTTNCFRGCCPEGVTCSEKVEPCGDSPENGYTADYVPTIARSLDDQYDANLIAGDDTDFIDSRSSVDCSLYMGPSAASTAPSTASDTTSASTAPEDTTTSSPINPLTLAPVAPTSPPTPEPTTAPEETPSPVEPPTLAPVTSTMPPTPESTPSPTTPEATTAPISPPTPAPVVPTSPPTVEATPEPTTFNVTPSPTDPATPVPAETQSPVPKPTPEPTSLEATPPPTEPVPAATQSPVAEPTPVPTTPGLIPSPTEPAATPAPEMEQPLGVGPTSSSQSQPIAASSALVTTSSLAPVRGLEGDAEGDITSGSSNDDMGYVEVGTRTTVAVAATAYDVFPGGDSGYTGCGTLGCLAALARDGNSTDIESRWSCANILVPDDGRCEIRFTFGEPVDLKGVQVAFWRVEERTRWLEVRINDDIIGIIESYPGSVFNSFDIDGTAVESVTFESTGIDDGEWLSLLEVRFLVEP